MNRCTQCGAQAYLVEYYQQGDSERFILQCPECRYAFVTDLFGQELGNLEEVAPERIDRLVASGLMVPLQAPRRWQPPY